MHRQSQSKWPEPEGVACPRCQSQDVAVCAPYVECLNCEDEKPGGGRIPYRFSHDEAIHLKPRSFSLH